MKNAAYMKLAPPKFTMLPLGSVKPGGWLRNQLKIQAKGLSGHLDEFWPDISDSGWIGGKAEGWERGPYWLDGIVPLAFLLDDSKLIRKVKKWMDYILAHQARDGWLGPRKMKRQHGLLIDDPWPIFIFLKALTQYQEATGDPGAISAMEKVLRRIDSLLNERKLNSWAMFRWADLSLSVYWLYDRTGEVWLLKLAEKIRKQGYDWQKHFRNFKYREKRNQWTMKRHVVNNAMAIKQPAVCYRLTKDKSEIKSAFNILNTLDKYHGQATGVFSGDEVIAGLNPSQGTELCAVVEYMYSLEMLLSVFGDTRFADRLEKIAFNALPATFKPDMWAHQYVQQSNQVICKVTEDFIYTTNSSDSNIYGLEPNFGCCTANMHQGWPKYASSLWMKTEDAGLVAVAYAPSTVKVKINGQYVRIVLKTDYPFSDTLEFTVSTDKSVEFPLYLRIPGWAVNAQVKTGKKKFRRIKPGGYFCIKREWEGNTIITMRLPMKVKIQKRYHNSISVERGPLVYSLKIGEGWKLVKGKPPHGDWEVYPSTAWNYALEFNTRQPENSLKFTRKNAGNCPFSPGGAPLVARGRGRILENWKIEHGAAGAPPESPVNSSQPLENIELLPYGCTNLRVTEFPWVIAGIRK